MNVFHLETELKSRQGFLQRFFQSFFISLFFISAVSLPAFAGGEVKKGGYLRPIPMDGLDGPTKTFDDFKGKPLLINIWASWCGPCRAEMGSLERLAQRYNGKQFNVIGISTDDYRDRAEGFIKQSGVSFENFLDKKLQLEMMLGARTIPLTILVDENGRVLEKVKGSREWDDREIVDAIAQIFKITLP